MTLNFTCDNTGISDVDYTVVITKLASFELDHYTVNHTYCDYIISPFCDFYSKSCSISE